MNKTSIDAIRERVGEIIGEASMCWSETPSGVFQTEKAVTLIDEIMTHILYPIEMPETETMSHTEIQLEDSIFEAITNKITDPNKVLTPYGESLLRAKIIILLSDYR